MAGENTMRSQAHHKGISDAYHLLSKLPCPQYTVPSATISRSIWLSMTDGQASLSTQVILSSHGPTGFRSLVSLGCL